MLTYQRKVEKKTRKPPTLASNHTCGCSRSEAKRLNLSNVLADEIRSLRTISARYYEQHAPALSYLLAKYTRAEEDNAFTVSDLSLIEFLKEEITYSPLAKLLRLVLKDFKEAYQSRFKFLKVRILHRIRELEDSLYNLEADIPAIKLELAMLCHDIYWDFHHPLQFQIDLRNWIEIAKKKTLGSQREKEIIALVERLIPTIENYGNGRQYHALIGPALLAHKMDYLKRKRAVKRSKKVVIIGSGVSGLIRLISAWFKHVDVSLIEEAEISIPHNVYKLHDLPLFHFLGITERLLLEKKIYPVVSNYFCVDSRDLYQALYQTVDDLGISKKTFQPGWKLKKISKGKVSFSAREGILMSRRADILVDASGSRGAVASLIDNNPVPMSEKNIMVMALFKKLPTVGKIQEGDFTSRAIKQFALRTPKTTCELILPKKKYQHQLQLAMENRKDKNRLKQLLTQIALQAAEDDPDIDHTHCVLNAQSIEQASAHSVQVNKRHPSVIFEGVFIQWSGDSLAMSDPLSAMGCTTAFKGATIFSFILDHLTMPVAEQQKLFVFGSTRQTSLLVEKSLNARKDGRASATIEFLLEKCVEEGWITSQEMGAILSGGKGSKKAAAHLKEQEEKFVVLQQGRDKMKRFLKEI